MVRPPDLTHDAHQDLRQLRAELQREVGRDVTIKETLNALVQGAVTDTGELPSPVREAVLRELGEGRQPPQRP